jgi:hypothetical protein
VLTIGQLASYAGTTVRAVRHYHAKGLLPEPERDASGYRRYGAASVVEIERDSWILIAAQLPQHVPAFMAVKHAQLEHGPLRQLYLDVGDLAHGAPDDPRLPALADRVVAFLEAVEAQYSGVEEEHPLSSELVALLDAAFVEHFPCARRLLALLEERGFTGWTDIHRKKPSVAAPGPQRSGLTDSGSSPGA